MIKDKVGQEIQVGQKAVWCSYNFLFIGTVKKITPKRVKMECITEMGVSKWTFMPLPEKILIVDELPKQTMFWALKGPITV